jgi:hypothetical protein
MQEWNLQHEAVRALLAFLGSFLALAGVLILGWFVGNRITYRWSLRQKRREYQLSAQQQFYAAYGEFFAVLKLWRWLGRTSQTPEDQRWKLHERAAAAEGFIEGVLVKLSSEVILEDKEIKSLGCFRQGFQQLREAIRENAQLKWDSSEKPEYKRFKELAVQVSALLAGEWKETCMPANTAEKQISAITSNEWEMTWADPS